MNAVMMREKGLFPISIGTSLALQSLINEHPDFKHPGNQLPVTRFEVLWINVKTLLRNIYNATDTKERDFMSPDAYLDALVEDMEFILEWAKNEGQGIDIFFYTSNYDGLLALYPKAFLRTDKTPKQKLYTDLLNKVLNELVGPDYQMFFKVKVFKLKVKAEADQYKKTLMLTNYAYDLIDTYQFSSLHLLESHTGAIKPKTEFYTKYYNGKDLINIPFREDFLQIFGDKELFAPQSLKLKQEVLKVAQQDHWTQVTTRDRIKASFDKIQNPYAREVLLSILSPK